MQSNCLKMGAKCLVHQPSNIVAISLLIHLQYIIVTQITMSVGIGLPAKKLSVHLAEHGVATLSTHKLKLWFCLIHQILFLFNQVPWTCSHVQ